MASNALKTPVAIGLELTAQRKVQDAIALLGKALPATVIAVAGSIVTVQFNIQTTLFTLPNVTIAKAESQWIRTPTQVGDQGMVIPSDVYLGGVTGLGGGTADLTQPANLSALVWVPVGNTGWSAAPDVNAPFINGPDGVILQDTAGVCVVKISHAGVFTVAINGVVVFTVNAGGIVDNGTLQIGSAIQAVGGATYAEPIRTSGDVIAGFGTGDQVSALNHTHQYNDPTGASTPAQTNAPTAGT